MSRQTFAINCVLLVLKFYSNYVYGCMCDHGHLPQEKICTADFAFVGKVLTKVNIPGQLLNPKEEFAKWKYTLRLIYPIKGDFSDVGSTVEIETPGNKTLCEMKLKIGDRYILSGREEDGVKLVLSCDLQFIRKSILNFEQMIYLFSPGSYSYVMNCKLKSDKNNTSGIDCVSPLQQKAMALFVRYYYTALCQYDNGNSTWLTDF